MKMTGLSAVAKVNQKKPRGHQRRADDREDPVAAGARDDLAAHDRRDHQAEDHRQHQEAALGRRRAVDQLQVQRDGHHRAEHAEADEHAEDGRHREGRAREELERDERVVAHERSTMMNATMPSAADDVAGDRAERAPAPVAALLGDEQQRHERERRPSRRPTSRCARCAGCAGCAGTAARSTSATMPIGRLIRKTQRHPVTKRISVGAGEQAADQRADDARDAEHGEEVALVLGALARGEDVAHDRERQRHEAAGAEALERAEARRAVHRGREAGERSSRPGRSTIAMMNSGRRPKRSLSLP